MLGAVDLVQPNAAPQLFESGAVDMLSTDPPRVVASAIGSYSCAEVWISRPVGTNAKFFVSLFGRVGDARVLLATSNAQDLTYTTDGTRQGAIALSVRGRPCSALELELGPSDDIVGIQIFLQAWHADIAHETTVGPERTVKVSQGPPAAASGLWPVYLSNGSTPQGQVNAPLFTRLSNGTAPQGVVTAPLFVQLSDGTAAFATPTNPAVVRKSRDTAKTFAVVGGAVASGTGGGGPNGTNSIGYLWKAGGSSRVEILRIIVSYHHNASTAGTLSIRGAHITTDPAGAGGTPAATIVAFDRADTTPAASFKWGHTAPTRQPDLILATVAGNQSGNFVWSAEDNGKPIVLRPAVNEGFEIRSVTASVTVAMTISVTFHWIEI